MTTTYTVRLRKKNGEIVVKSIDKKNLPRHGTKWGTWKKVRSYEDLPKTDKAIDDFFLNGGRKGRYTAGSIRMLKTELDLFFEVVHKEYTKVISDDVMGFMRYYIEEKKPKPASESLMRSVLRSFFKFLIDTNKIKINPTTALRPMAFTSNDDSFAIALRKKTLTRNEVAKLLNAINHPRDKALFTLIYSHGLRCSEAANLTQDCVDFQKNELIIRNTKGGKSRRNNMLPAIRSLLKIWLTYRGELGHDYVFTTLRHKKPIRTDIIRALLNKYLKKSGIDLKNRHITVHSLRHSFISHMLSPEIGASIGKVSRFVGHQSITMTMKYSHFDEMEKDEYLEKFTVPVC